MGNIRLPSDSQPAADKHVIGREPSPGFSTEFAEKYERLLKLLEADVQEIATLNLEGFSNDVIAQEEDQTT